MKKMVIKAKVIVNYEMLCEGWNVNRPFIQCGVPLNGPSMLVQGRRCGSTT